MACLHDMRDMDTHYKIDPEKNMAITNANSEKNSLQLGDHDSEIFTFEIPKEIDGHCMTLCDRVQVHFINTSTDKMDVSKDVYKVTNMEAAEDDPETLVFTWKISGNATMYAGNLSFRILFACSDGNGGYSYKKWTSVFKDVYILDGFDNGEAVVADYSDILEQWEKELFGAGDSVIADIEAASEAQKQAIEDKGAEVLASIPDDYTETHNMAEEGARTKADAIVQTAQGEVIVATDCSDDHVRNLRVFGKTTQNTTKGYQLFDASKLGTHVLGNANVTNNGDGSFTVAGSGTMSSSTGFFYDYTHEESVKMLKAGNLTLGLSEIPYPYCYAQLRNSKQVYFALTGNRPTQEVTQEMLDDIEMVLRFGFYGDSETTIIPGTIKPMLYQDGDGTWEPFTGGQASPNPDYPQELASVENPVINIYGKNMFNGELSGGIYMDNNFALDTSNPDVYKSIKTGLMPGVYTVSFGKPVNIVREVINGVYSVVNSVIGGTEYTFEVKKFGSVGLTFRDATSMETVWDETTKIQIELGSQTTQYEPCKGEQSVSVLHELHAISVSSGGNYTDASGQQWIADEVDLEKGVLVQRIRERTFDGGESWAYATTGVTRFLLKLADSYVDDGASTNKYPMLCNQYITGASNEVYQFDKMCAISTGTLWLSDTDYKDVDSWKAHLAETNLVLAYALAEPIETPLTAEEIEAFKALRTNYLTTTVLNDAGAWMEISYNADTKTFVVNNQTPATDEQIESAVNAYLEANPPSVDPLILTDQNTGKKYTLAVIDGKLTMSEVTI